MKAKTNTGEVELTAEMVCRGIVFEVSQPVGATTLRVAMPDPAEFRVWIGGKEHDVGSLFRWFDCRALGCDPTVATRANCERYGIPEHIDAVAHGFARLRDGGAVDLRREMPRGSVYVIGGKRNTWNGRSVPLPDEATFIGLDARYARPEDVERLCCGAHRQWVDGDRLRDAMCTLAIGPHDVHEDLATGARWRDAPKVAKDTFVFDEQQAWADSQVAVAHALAKDAERRAQTERLMKENSPLVSYLKEEISKAVLGDAAPKCARCDGPASVKEGYALTIALQSSNGSMESGKICEPCAALVHANPEGWVFENGRIRARPGMPSPPVARRAADSGPACARPEAFVNIELGPLQAHLTRRLCWIRLFGFGLKVADRAKVRPLYSERLDEIRIGRIGISVLGRGQ